MSATTLPSPLFVRRGAAILFEEDFDLQPVEVSIAVALPEPEVIEPTFTVAEMQVARDEAWREADALARTELAGAREQAVEVALRAIAEQLRGARSEARIIAEASAEAVAQLVIGGLAAAFPALCRHHGSVEIAAIMREILPSLECEPKITIRVAPGLVPCVEQEIGQLDSDVADIIKVVAVESMTPGDVRLQWRGGQAIRDTARLWQDIEAALASAGLLPASPGTVQQKLKEDADVE